MKSSFSIAWLSSKQPRKQHKFVANAPLHIKHSFLNSHLSKDLRTKYNKRSLAIRKGDEVMVMRGEFKKKKAKITLVDHKRIRVALENLQRTKKDGTKVNVWFRPSSLQIISLNIEDKKRIASLERNKNSTKESKLNQKSGEKDASDKSTSK